MHRISSAHIIVLTFLLGGALALAACANAKPGDPIDAGTDAAVIIDAMPDATIVPDASYVSGTCGPCESNANCESGSQCVSYGNENTCLVRCNDTSDCPDGFQCTGVETRYCSPNNGICCIDGDDDTYGYGVQCAGDDCDDTDVDVHPGMPELCNGIDDDCDANTDDGSGDVAVGVACDGADLDLCDEGTTSCDNGAIACDDLSSDNLDICNGMDDDCNPATLDGSADAQVGTACDSNADGDLCNDDVYICDSGIPAVVCQNLPGGGPDICDGADNDCNPFTPDGADDPGVGLPCDGNDVDLCNEGTTYCDSATILCDDPNDVDLELCDGFDNDCNPATLDGSQDPDVGAACDGSDTDLCEEGVTICSTGLEICTDNTGSSTEICNGIDDDCNNSTDEMDPNNTCPSQHPGAGNVITWGCSGACYPTACLPGFGDVDGFPSNGCECGGLDSYGNSCASATSQTVALGATVDVVGKIDTAMGSDWIRFNFSDRAAPSTYHPRVELVDDGGAQFTMDVRTDCASVASCNDGGGGTDIDVWESTWTYTAGPGCCSDGDPHINSVWVRVYRSAGDPATCTSYTVRATNP